LISGRRGSTGGDAWEGRRTGEGQEPVTDGSGSARRRARKGTRLSQPAVYLMNCSFSCQTSQSYVTDFVLSEQNLGCTLWYGSLQSPSHLTVYSRCLSLPSFPPAHYCCLPAAAAAGDAPLFQPSAAIWRASAKQLFRL